MKLYSWNVNGIRAVWNKGALQDFVIDHQPDILCLQETKAQQEQSPVDLPGYVEIWNSAVKKGYSGTAIFSKTEPQEILMGFSSEINSKFDLKDKFGDTTTEGRVLSARFPDFWVVTVYTPNSKGKLERLGLRFNAWDPAFLMHVQELEKTAPVLFCGDLNVAHQEIDLARPAENVGKHGFTDEERKGFDSLLASGFIDTFRTLHPDLSEAYSWWTAWGGARARNVGWRIDYWLASSAIKDRIVSASIHPEVMGSDHCPVSIEIK
jgi:exodeoxyribonuclease-3